MVSVYLASPLGFADSTRHFMEHLIERLDPHVEVSNPWDDKRFEQEFARIAEIDSRAEAHAALAKINTELGRSNAVAIRDADGLVEILDDVDIDSDTATEIGYVFG
ncbi:MAG: nucleoside 2-deoxyribosyltransferase, partial [Thermomicrobiales bacterium]|nr:nucleoside 2-deoxyribosyltransferase [Thermomicrobiales bacterium]